MFLEESEVIGGRKNIIHDDFIHSLYDCANMVQPMEAVRRHLDNYSANFGFVDKVGIGI